MLSVPATVSAETWTISFSWDPVDNSVQYDIEEDIPEDEVYIPIDDWGWGWDDDHPKFSTSLKPEITAAPAAEGILITWDYIINADHYRVYRYNEKTNKYVKLGDTYDSSYYDKTVKAGTSYSYKIKAYDYNGKESKLSDAAKATVDIMAGPLTLAVTSSSLKLSWKKSSNADGYEVWYYKKKISSKDKDAAGSVMIWDYYTYTDLYNSGSLDTSSVEFKKLKTTASTSYSIKRDKNYNYYFKLRAYRLKDGKKVYSEFTSVERSGDAENLMIGAKGKTKTSVKQVSYRSDVSSGTLTYSAADKKIMDAFAKEHFTSDMNVYDKAFYLSVYIHENVKYAETSSELNKISSVSPTKAIFEYKLGQCYQYNAAFMLFLAYLGLDVRLIASYRGNSWSDSNKISHYWGEITLDGKKFVLDAGNTNSGLYYFCVPYKDTTRYLRK